MPIRVKIWDLPTRLFHWLLVVLFSASVLTVQFDELVWHERSGIAILVLVTARIIWAFIGSETSRFSHFIKGPRSIIRYLSGIWRDRGNAVIGHNPVGGWVVVAFFVLLLLQAGTGLFANDEIFFEGPLAKHASREMSDTLTSVHHLIGESLLILVLIHILANILYWLVLKQNLIGPMLGGFKNLDSDPPKALKWQRNAVALATLTAVALIVWATIGFR